MIQKMQNPLKYVQGYPRPLLEQIATLIRDGNLADWLKSKYPDYHQIKTDKALLEYTMAFKNRYLKKAPPLQKVIYDNRIHIVNNALGLHSYVSRVQGSKLKRKNEIRIAELFRNSPEPLLRMLVVHELAHLKEKGHDKAFYALCCHMEPDYHQLELDARLFLTWREIYEE